MSIIKLFGGVTRAEHHDLVEEVKRLKNLIGEPDALLVEARNAATSARQDANSAANSAAAARLDAHTAGAAVDNLNEALANQALDIADLDHRVKSLEGGEVVEPEPKPEPTPPGPEPVRKLWSLTVDPAFDANRLPPTARTWHARLLKVIERIRNWTDHTGTGGVRGLAQAGDLYQLARPVRGAVFQILAAFRATGDQAILDAVKVIVDDMRSALKPGWRGVTSTPSGCPGGNGYIEPGQWPDGIWTWDAEPEPTHRGRDVHLTDDQKAVSVVAYYALACEQNRHIPRFAADADYWKAFLINWEAKWRSNRWGRRNRPTGPIFRRSTSHSTHGEMTLYVILHRLTSDPAYLAMANSLRGDIWADMRTVGDAYVWPRGIQSIEAGKEFYLMPATYARYVFDDALALHMEGFAPYDDPAVMRRFAGTLSLMMNSPTSSDVLKGNVGGDQTRAGIPSTAWSGVSGVSYASQAGYALVERFDPSVAGFNAGVYDRLGYGDDPRGVSIVAAKLLAAT